MAETTRPRRVRADAERSTARILEAAEAVLAVDPAATLERIADAAGLARATVHRRFSSRKALVEAMVESLNDRYRLAAEQARVETAPPVAALHRLNELVFELKIRHCAAVEAASLPGNSVTAPSEDILKGLDKLFDRLRRAGETAVDDQAWARRVYLSTLHEVHQLPDDSPVLTGQTRADLLTRTVLGALGGKFDI